MGSQFQRDRVVCVCVCVDNRKGKHGSTKLPDHGVRGQKVDNAIKPQTPFPNGILPPARL